MVAITEDRVASYVRARLSSERLGHTIGVVETAATLAARYGADPRAARYAGWLHDIARETAPDTLLALAGRHGIAIDAIEEREPLLLHGKIGAALAREELGLDDGPILTAIAQHITGDRGMPLLSRLVFLADFIEPGRTYDAAARARAEAREDLDRALLTTFDAIITHVMASGYLLHPRTVDARNELLAAMAKA